MSNLTTLTPTAEAVTVQLSTPVTPTTPVAASVDPGCIFESKDTLVKYLQEHPVITVTTFCKTEVDETLPKIIYCMCGCIKIVYPVAIVVCMC